jgi:hypothetical protein
MRDASPSLVFAVIGQARADQQISPEEESRLLTNLLTYWALRGTLDMAAYCGQRIHARAIADHHSFNFLSKHPRNHAHEHQTAIFANY